MRSLHPRFAISLLYGLHFAVYGLVLPFLPLIFHARGLSDIQISVALSAVGLATLTSPLIFSHLADSNVSVRGLIGWSLAGAGFMIPFWLVVKSLWLSALITFLHFAFYIPAANLVDTFTLDYVAEHSERSGRKLTFLSLRLWGSIGFMLPSLVLLAASLSGPISTGFLVVLAASFSFAAAATAMLLPASKAAPHPQRIPARAALACALTRPLRDFFGSTTLAGLGIAMFVIAFPRYLQELGCSTAEVGLMINLGVLSEVVCIPLSTALIGRFGAERAISLGLWAFTFRLIVIALFPSLWVVGITQLLHAPLVIGLFLTGPMYLREHSQAGFHYSLQSMYITLVLGISRLVGPWLLAAALASQGGGTLPQLQTALLSSGLLGAVGYVWWSLRPEMSNLRP